MTALVESIAKEMRPLFVLSLPRSGSTLLYTLLNQHSQIALLYEGDLPTMQLYLHGQFRNGNWRERWEFWNQGPSRHGIPLDSMPAQVSDVREATRIVYQSVARNKGATIWGEKSPFWYDDPLPLAGNFPDASFIFLWRDMRDVMGSITRAAFAERSFRRLAARPATLLLGNERLKRACEQLKTRGWRVHEVDYEDLTANTSECIKRVCQFLDVPFDGRMTSLEGADRSAVGVSKIHEAVRGDRIVRQRKQTQVLSSEVHAKVSRYICYWKLRYASAWPTYPVELPEGTRLPSSRELLGDQLADQFRRLWDKALVVMLHQIRPLFYPKKYIRRPEPVAHQAGSTS